MKPAYINEMAADFDAFRRPRPHGFTVTKETSKFIHVNARRYPTIEAAKKAAEKKGLTIVNIYLNDDMKK